MGYIVILDGTVVILVSSVSIIKWYFPTKEIAMIFASLFM